MKKNFIAIAACIVAISFISLVSCTKDVDNNDIINHVQKSTMHQFDRIGEMHNEILWDLGEYFQKDLHNIVRNGGISEEDALNLQQKIEEWERNRCFQLGCDTNNISENWHIDVEESLNNVMVDSMLNDILNNATSMNDLFSEIEERENTLSSQLNTFDDTIQLMSLVIMRYSLDFWIDAYNNQENPWHEIAYYMPFPTTTKGLPGLCDKFKRWVNDKLIPFIGEVVTAAVELLGMDYIVWQSSSAGWIAFGAAFGNPELGLGIAIGFSAAGSAIGGIHGWTNPWF